MAILLPKMPLPSPSISGVVSQCDATLLYLQHKFQRARSLELALRRKRKLKSSPNHLQGSPVYSLEILKNYFKKFSGFNQNVMTYKILLIILYIQDF
ncbi:hypothetical protein PRUPE_3G114800 [Prunus persica]|uniref:Uncharacterized protein n=1 Tax=Prunus persica TaxID=3760 RepID=A0A251PYL8_PRUPE|nr:hypothetical protein PRUPE_3G114800 [Prunus persica]